MLESLENTLYIITVWFPDFEVLFMSIAVVYGFGSYLLNHAWNNFKADQN